MSVAPLHDVLVVGAGPAGSTAAALLARHGQRVLVLEKEHFPRFHVGESLLPGVLPVLERLGVEPARDAFLFKAGAEFVSESDGRAQRFPFDEALPGGRAHAWHVDRADFDTRLRDAARDAGADVRHGVTVHNAQLADDHVRVESSAGTHRARFVVDASGQDRLLGRLHATLVPYEQFGAAAVFTRFEQLGDAAFEELGPGHEIRVMLRDDGWGWLIPLPGRRLSVGMVARERVTPALLDDGLLAGPLARRLTAGAVRGDTGVIRNYSYRNERPVGPRFAAVGDAACFLDPVFSSGVLLALRGAETLADALAPALAERREADPELLRPHQAHMQRGYSTFAALIERFYGGRFAENMFLSEVGNRPLRAGVLSVLAGDVWRDDNPFQELLLSARRRPASKR